MTPYEPPRANAAFTSAHPEGPLAFSAALEHKPIWSTLYDQIRDAWFAPKLPELLIDLRTGRGPRSHGDVHKSLGRGNLDRCERGALVILVLLALEKVIPHPTSILDTR